MILLRMSELLSWKAVSNVSFYVSGTCIESNCMYIQFCADMMKLAAMRNSCVL